MKVPKLQCRLCSIQNGNVNNVNELWVKLPKIQYLAVPTLRLATPSYWAVYKGHLKA